MKQATFDLILILFTVLGWSQLLCLFTPRGTLFLQKLYPRAFRGDDSNLIGLDAIRGVSAVFVALFHLMVWTKPSYISAMKYFPILLSGNKIVPIFITLSGLLVFRKLSHISRIEDISFYFRGRFIRIYPVYFSTILFSAIFLDKDALKDPLETKFLLSDIFMLQIFNYPHVFNPPAWSLYVEVLFYLLAPLLIFFLRQREFIYIPLAILIFGLSGGIQSDEFSLWKYFFCGMLSGSLIDSLPISEKRAIFVSMSGAIIIYFSMLFPSDAITRIISVPFFAAVISAFVDNGDYPLMLGIGTMIFFYGLVHLTQFKYLLNHPAPKILSLLSYSLFLWHSFIISLSFSVSFDGSGGFAQTRALVERPFFEVFVIYLPAFVGIASLSYHCIERPSYFLWENVISPGKNL